MPAKKSNGNEQNVQFYLDNISNQSPSGSGTAKYNILDENRKSFTSITVHTTTSRREIVSPIENATDKTGPKTLKRESTVDEEFEQLEKDINSGKSDFESYVEKDRRNVRKMNE